MSGSSDFIKATVIYASFLFVPLPLHNTYRPPSSHHNSHAIQEAVDDIFTSSGGAYTSYPHLSLNEGREKPTGFLLPS